MNEEEIDVHIMGVVLLHQYNMKKVIDLFGNRADEVVMKGLHQIHEMNTYEPMDTSKLTCEERKVALDSSSL